MILEQLILIAATLMAFAYHAPELGGILFAALMLCSGIDKILRQMRKSQK